MTLAADGTYYCQCCAAEIPAGEETHEFTTKLLAKKGHCHAECLDHRNMVLAQFNNTIAGLAALFDPGVHTAQKASQASHIEARRNRQLKRAPAAQPVAMKTPAKKRALKAKPAPKKVTKRARVPKKVKRGA